MLGKLFDKLKKKVTTKHDDKPKTRNEDAIVAAIVGLLHPTVTGMTPHYGTVGQVVTVVGSNFGGISATTIDNTTIVVQNISPTSFELVIPDLDSLLDYSADVPINLVIHSVSFTQNFYYIHSSPFVATDKHWNKQLISPPTSLLSTSDMTNGSLMLSNGATLLVLTTAPGTHFMWNTTTGITTPVSDPPYAIGFPGITVTYPFTIELPIDGSNLSADMYQIDANHVFCPGISLTAPYQRKYIMLYTMSTDTWSAIETPLSNIRTTVRLGSFIILFGEIGPNDATTVNYGYAIFNCESSVVGAFTSLEATAEKGSVYARAVKMPNVNIAYVIGGFTSGHSNGVYKVVLSGSIDITVSEVALISLDVRDHALYPILGDQIMIIGGKSATSGGTPCYNSMYNTTLDICTTQDTMPEYMIDPKVHLLGEFLFVFGGYANDYQLGSTATLIYDTVNGTWTYSGDLNVARLNCSSFVLGERIWCVGGYLGFSPEGANTALNVFFEMLDNTLPSCDILGQSWAADMDPVPECGVALGFSNLHTGNLSAMYMDVGDTDLLYRQTSTMYTPGATATINPSGRTMLLERNKCVFLRKYADASSVYIGELGIASHLPSMTWTEFTIAGMSKITGVLGLAERKVLFIGLNSSDESTGVIYDSTLTTPVTADLSTLLVRRDYFVHRVGNFAYFLGGTDPLTGDPVVVIEKLNLTTYAVSLLAPTYARGALTNYVPFDGGDKIAILGGTLEFTGGDNEVEVFNVGAETVDAAVISTNLISGAQCILLNDTLLGEVILIVGGDYAPAKAFYYDPVAKTFTDIALSTGTHSNGLVVYDTIHDGVCVAGGAATGTTGIVEHLWPVITRSREGPLRTIRISSACEKPTRGLLIPKTLASKQVPHMALRHRL